MLSNERNLCQSTYRDRNYEKSGKGENCWVNDYGNVGFGGKIDFGEVRRT